MVPRKQPLAQAVIPDAETRWLRWLPRRDALVAAVTTSALAILFAPAQATGDVSLRCVYELMTSIPYYMDICGDTIDRDSNKALSNLRSSLKKFINKNARQDRDRIGKDFDQERSHVAKRVGQGNFCETEDYTLFKDILGHILAPEHIASIQMRLQSSEGPSEGDCL